MDRAYITLHCMRCCQGCSLSAGEWTTAICSSLEGASYRDPRGKHARHADIVQVVHIVSPSLDSVLTSVNQLAVTEQLLRCSQQEDTVITNTHSSVAHDAR